MKRNMMQWVEEQIAAKTMKGFPVLSFPAIQKMNITVKELVNSSDLQAEAMKLVADLTPDGAASVSMMDLSVEAEAFGSQIHLSEDEVPTVLGTIVEDEEGADALQIPEVGAGRTGIYIEAIHKASEMITDRPVFAGVIGPFSLAGRLVGVTDAMIDCYDEPDMMHTVLQKATDFLIRYINAYKEAGANGVLMAEPLAGLLSPDLEEEFSAEYVKKIIAQTQTEEFLTCYHNCGNSTVLQSASIGSNGSRVFHFGNAIEMTDILPKLPSDVLVMGNLDPAGLLKNGTPEAVRAQTLALLEKCGSYPNFLISSGCDMPPMTPWENIDAFYAAIREYNDTRVKRSIAR